MSRGVHRRYDSCREHEHEWQTHTFSTDENADRMRLEHIRPTTWNYFKVGRLADAEAALPLNRLHPIQDDRDHSLRRIANGRRDQESASVAGCGVAGAVVLPIAGDVRSEQLNRPAGLDDISGRQRD